jgi:hypothetical protein
MAPIKKLSRAPVSDGRRSLGLHNNQQNDGVGGGGGVGEETQPGATRGEGRVPII